MCDNKDYLQIPDSFADVAKQNFQNQGNPSP